jgi:hypothetical protein
MHLFELEGFMFLVNQIPYYTGCPTVPGQATLMETPSDPGDLQKLPLTPVPRSPVVSITFRVEALIWTQ